jgi:hypothetical protein
MSSPPELELAGRTTGRGRNATRARSRSSGGEVALAGLAGLSAGGGWSKNSLSLT